MERGELIQEKLREIASEMKLLGMWKKQPPGWVHEFNITRIYSEDDFNDWLQFVYLPNLKTSGISRINPQKEFIAPQAMKFFGTDITRGKLLELLIELDSLT